MCRSASLRGPAGSLQTTLLLAPCPPPPTPACVVQVRRVAALENHPMLSSEEDSVQERIPPGHCWVLADNEALEPPEVIDSRAFGYLDMNLITGRVVYRVNRGD